MCCEPTFLGVLAAVFGGREEAIVQLQGSAALLRPPLAGR